MHCIEFFINFHHGNSDFPKKCDFCVIIWRLLKLEWQLFCLQTWRESMLQHASIRKHLWFRSIWNIIFKWFFKIFTWSIQLSIQLIYNYYSRLEILGSILKWFYFQYTHMLHHKHYVNNHQKIQWECLSTSDDRVLLVLKQFLLFLSPLQQMTIRC